LTSLKVDLKAVSSDYLDQLRRWRNDQRIFSWCRQYEEISKLQHQSWFESLPKRTDVKMYEIWIDGGIYGVCGFTSIDYINRHAEFSLYIDPNRHGLGYGEASLRALIKHGFEVLNLNSIWGESFDGNPAQRIFKKIGFKHVGSRREFYYRNGKYVDAHVWDITKSDYDGDLNGITDKLCVDSDINVGSLPSIE
jgi:RimJ/RimL family protein N-acetyltransferase